MGMLESMLATMIGQDEMEKAKQTLNQLGALVGEMRNGIVGLHEKLDARLDHIVNLSQLQAAAVREDLAALHADMAKVKAHLVIDADEVVKDAEGMHVLAHDDNGATQTPPQQ
jgi:hypothetical protein